MTENEIYHFGVKGMKWGVRKDRYKAASKAERKAIREEYRKTPVGRMEKSASIGALIGGVPGALIAQTITYRKFGPTEKAIYQSYAKGVEIVGTTLKKHENTTASEMSKSVSVVSAKTQSKRVADLKSRVTGKKEDGKPAFLMSEKEYADFDAKYEQRKSALSKQLKSATSESSKKRIGEQLTRLENDYLSVVEQDFWYSDD